MLCPAGYVGMTLGEGTKSGNMKAEEYQRCATRAIVTGLERWQICLD